MPNGISPNDQADRKLTKGTCRRKILKTTGVSLAGLAGIPVSSAGKPTRRKVIENGLRIRNRTNSTDRFVEYLRNHDFTVGRQTSTVSMGNSDGVSTQKLDEGDLTIDFIIYYECYTCDYDCVVDLSWNWSGQDVDDWGEPPRDVTGFYWEDVDWNIATSDYYRSDRVYFDGFSDTHVHFEFDDQGGDDGTEYYCASLLTPTGTAPESNREVGGEYVHTYDDVGINSVSGGFPAGLSVELTNNEKKWDHHEVVDQSQA